MTMRIVALDPAELSAFETPSSWPPLSAEEMLRHAPDVTLAVVQGESLLARCSLWWRDTPSLEGRRVGAIGHYGGAGAEASGTLLAAACERLAREGCAVAVGPMDGNTWRRYRLVVERGTEPPFFLEPENPGDWPAQFTGAGFAPLASYLSALNTDLGQRDPRAAQVAERLASNGVVVRTLDPGRFDEELSRIHRVAALSFRDAFLYTALPEPEFVAQYRAVQRFVRPELVLIAEREGEPVGFSFSVPDVLEQARGEQPRTIVFKTLAVLPDRRLYSGLGSLMADRTHLTAQSLGYTRAVHALIHEANHSRAMSERTGHTIRRYALYSRAIA